MAKRTRPNSKSKIKCHQNVLAIISKDFPGVSVEDEEIWQIIEDSSGTTVVEKAELISTYLVERSFKATVPEKKSSNPPIDLERFECQCCYGSFSFEQMIQCQEGHLCCHQCLTMYTKETIYGQGKSSLSCMASDCDASYPRSQILIAVPEDIRKKFEDRLLQDDVNIAALEGFYRCIGCGFGAILDSEQNYFDCTQCEKHFCKKCNENFEDHHEVECEQVERKNEVQFRLKYEEKMSEAKIRTCSHCKTKFTKTTGCNLITCRCGAYMCYICRKPKIWYDHFTCRHKSKAICKKFNCNGCSLITTCAIDDEMAINEFKKRAKRNSQKHGFKRKIVGPPVEKKRKAYLKKRKR